MILTIISLLLFIGVGYLTCVYFNIFDSLLFNLSLSFAVGIGIISTIMFIYSVCNIPWTISNVLIPLVLYSLVLIYKMQKAINIKSFKFKNILTLSSKERLLVVGILLIVLFVGFESIVRPVYAWDAWSSWLMKSKMFYIEKGIKPNQFFYLNSEYPPIISISGSFVYLMQGTIDDRNVLLFFYTFYVFIGLLLFGLLFKTTDRFTAFLFTFLFLSIQNIIRHGGRFEAGQADLALSYFFLCVYVLFLEFTKRRKLKILIILQFIIGVTILIKNEGLPFILIFEGMLLPSFLKNKRLLISLLGLIFPAGLWEWYKYSIHLPTNYIFQNFQYNYFDIKNILLAMGRELINIEHWNLLWIVFALSSTISLLINSKKSIEIKIAIVIVMIQLLIYFLIFMITPVDPPSVHVINVFDRLLIHISPFALIINANIYWLFIKARKYE